MKRILAILMAMVLLLGSTAAMAEEPNDTYVPTASEVALTGRPVSEEPTHVTVGNPTKVNGAFYTSQFGNNTSDIDVRAMVHGYNLVAWADQLEFITDPMVVKEMTTAQTAEGTVYTVTLQDNLLWNDGETPVTAADYVFSVLLQASDEFAAIGANTAPYTHIVGYEEYAAGKTDALKGVRLLGEKSLSVTVKTEYEPYFYELAYLSIEPSPISVLAPGCQVTDSAAGAKIEGPFTAELLRTTVLDAAAGYLSHPAFTCGPYTMTGYVPETGVVDFAINPYYVGNFEGVKPVIDAVTLLPVTSDNMIRQLQDGVVNVLNKVVDADNILDGRMNLVDGYTTMNYPRLGYGFLALACEKGPQQFQAVRQAIAYAFDTKSFITQFLSGFGIKVDGYYGLGQWMFRVVGAGLRPAGELSEETAAAWDAISLSSLKPYDYDLEAAKQLLIDDGWTLNAQGAAFDAEQDTLRYKSVGNELMALSFRFAKSPDNDAAKLAVKLLGDAFAELGAELVVEEVSFAELLNDYYRTDDQRRFDMNFMATNFVSTFDPYMTFADGADYQGVVNTSGLKDEQLIDIAWKMHTTPSNDTLTYLQRWQQFQERFNEVLPTIPLYSNIYFDFCTDSLHNYYANSETNWPSALLYSYWMEEEEAPAGEDEFVFE